MQYLSYGLPVVCQRLPAIEKYHEKYNVCQFFDGTSGDLAEKINELIQNNSLRTKLAKNAINAVKENENWTQRVNTILSDFEKIKSGLA